MEKRLMTFLTLLFVGIGLMTAQTRKVTGTVLSDEDGLPVIGASVLVKGTSMGTVTDMDGIFVLNNIPESAKTLVVSYIGMKAQDVKIQANVRVVLYPDTEVLDEVMVVAFGKAKKSAFTGSASVVKSDKIIGRQASNVTNALSGQVAGVQTTSSNGQPGESAKVRIRGIGSIAAGNDPLYVVDGVPYDGAIASINPQDIESMTVLKDAASNALYGARGANGVILITTRSGKKDGKATINVDAKWGSNRRAIPNYDVIKSPAEYYELTYQSIYNPLVPKMTPEEANAKANEVIFTPKDGGLGYQVYTLPQGEGLIGMNGKLNPNATLGYSNGTYFYKPDNWFDEVFDTGNLRQEYNVSVSGASDKINYFMSAGYLDDKGIIPNSGYTRYTTRLKSDYQATKWLKVGANMSYVNSKSSYPRDQSGSSSANIFYVANSIAPIYPLYIRDANGDIMTDRRGYTMYDFGEGPAGTRPFMSQSNPASAIELDKRLYTTDFFSGKGYANISFIENLVLSLNIGTDVTNRRTATRLNPYYGQYVNSGGILSAASLRQASINKQALLTYNVDFDKHGVDFLVGYEAYDLKMQSLSGSKEKIYNPDNMDLDNAILKPVVGSYTEKYSTAGYLFRSQYNYDNKYFGSFSFRRDGSSRFHKDNRWGNFWSLGAGWLISQEEFMKDVKWVNMLKFKMSYGLQGNDDLRYSNGVTNYYPYLDQYALTNQNEDFGLALDYKGNKDITWETSQSFNTGFDFELLNNRLNGSVEYFSRKTTDMLYYKPTPLSWGYSSLPMNVGSMVNRGVEIDLTAVAYTDRNITWDINFNMTHFKNKILKLDKSLNGELIDGSRIYREKESLYQMYLRKYAGVDSETGRALYYKNTVDKNGKVTGRETTDDWNKATQYATGDILPKVYGGFGTTLRVYDFDFGMSFAYQLGGKVYDNTYQRFMHNGGGSSGMNWHKDIRNAWTPENKNTSVPALAGNSSYSNSTSDRFLINSNYLSLQNITLGYTVPKKALNKIGMGSLRVYIVADNVALFSKRKGLDPRQGYLSSDNSSYSPMRTISGGLTLTF